MIFNLPIQYDLNEINLRRQCRADKDIKRINAKRYSVGEQVMKKTFDPAKLDDR